jgi:hypothetical protein
MWANEFRKRQVGEAKQRPQSICSIPGVKRQQIFQLKKRNKLSISNEKKIRGSM